MTEQFIYDFYDGSRNLQMINTVSVNEEDSEVRDITSCVTDANDDSIVDIHISSEKYPEGVSKAAMDFWLTYRDTRRIDTVIRSGFGLCGIYDYEPGVKPDANRPESGSEHSLGTINIACNFAEFFPKLMPYDKLGRAIDILRYHDVGEAEIGDLPDDGSQSAEQKDAAELVYIMKCVHRLPSDKQMRIIQDFKKFQDPLHFWGEDSEFIQAVKLCDKLDAPLKGILYEEAGHPGNLLYKKENHGGITEQDKYFSEVTGDSSLSAVWAAHFASHYHDYYGFDVIVEILKAAVTSVRGEWFPWWDEFLEREGIVLDPSKSAL